MSQFIRRLGNSRGRVALLVVGFEKKNDLLGWIERKFQGAC